MGMMKATHQTRSLFRGEPSADAAPVASGAGGTVVEEGLVLDVDSGDEVEDSAAEEPARVTLLASALVEEAEVGAGVVVSEAEASELEADTEEAWDETSDAADEDSEGTGVAVVRRVVGAGDDGFDDDSGGGAEVATDDGGVDDDSTG